VHCIYCDVADLLSFYTETIIIGANSRKIKTVELALGGDHGKGAFTFLVSLVIFYSDDDGKMPKCYDFVIGEIHYNEDSLELLMGLLEKQRPGLLRLNMNSDTGRCRFKI
jgi:hypothetical protein